MADGLQPATSIYGGYTPPAAMTPLDALNTVRAAQDVQGRSKIGEIYKSATDPNTGQIDQSVIMKRAHEAGVLAPELVTTALQNAHQGVVLDHAKLLATREAWSNMGDMIAAHVDDPGFNYDKATDLIMRMVGDPKFGGMIGHEAAIKALRQMINPATGKPDPALVQRWARGMISMTMGARDQTEMIPYQMDNNGNQTYITRNGMLVRQQQQREAGGAGAPAQPFTTTSTVSPERQAVIAGSGRQQATDYAGTQSFPADMSTLNQALTKAKALGPTGTGPYKDKLNEVQSAMQAFAPSIARWAGIDPKQVSDFEELKKYLTVAMQQRANSLGGVNSDMQLATMITGNPSTNLSQMSIVDMLKYNMALRRMEQARALHLNAPYHPQNNPHGDQGNAGPLYSKRSADWGNEVDPRGFAYDLLEPEERKKFIDSLGRAERERVNKAVEIGRHTQVMNF